MGNYRGVTKAVLVAAAAIALAACANTSLKHGNPPDSLGASGAQSSSGVTRPPHDPRAIMVDRAKSMLGHPYRWGGDAPGGIAVRRHAGNAAQCARIRVP